MRNSFLSFFFWAKEKIPKKFYLGKISAKEYKKGIVYSKEEMKQYEGVNIHRNDKLKKWSILITPLI